MYGAFDVCVLSVHGRAGTCILGNISNSVFTLSLRTINMFVFMFIPAVVDMAA